MQWSKVQKRFEALLAPCLHGRLKVHVTRYRETKNFDVGRGWITVDNEEVVSTMVPSVYDRHMDFPEHTLDLGRALGNYVDMSIEAVASSTDPILRGLMFLDRRIGKRTLACIDKARVHDFEKALYAARCRAEGIEW